MQQPASSSTSVVQAYGTSDKTTRPGVAGAAAKSHEPASNTAAVVTLAAGAAGVSNILHAATWSYDGDPTAGTLTVQDGSAVWLKIDITAKGPGQIVFDPPLKGTAATAMVVTLAAGGAGVSGIVNVHAGTES